MANMGMPRPETKRSGIFGKIWDLDRDCGVWSGPDRVPIGPGLNFPNTSVMWDAMAKQVIWMKGIDTIRGRTWRRIYSSNVYN